MDGEKELKQQVASVTQQLKQEQSTIGQLRSEIVAKEDTIEQMSQDTDQLVN